MKYVLSEYSSVKPSHDTKSSSNIGNIFDDIGSPQGDGLSGCLFITYLEKALHTLREQVNNNNVTGEHSYAVRSKGSLLNECIYNDNTDLISECAEKKIRQL